MRRTWWTAYIAAILLGAAGCGGSTTAPSATSPTLHGEVSDPIGDAGDVPDPSVPVFPDLVRGTVDVSAGNISFTVQFAPGTFDRSTTRVTIDLDTDQNLSTGINSVGLGIDYAVDMWAPTGQTTILKAVPTGTCTASNPCYVPMGMAPLTFVTDGMQVTVPLSLLGNASGRLNFRVLAYVSPQMSSPTVGYDFMPDKTLPPGHVQ